MLRKKLRLVLNCILACALFLTGCNGGGADYYTSDAASAAETALNICLVK